MNTIYFHTRSFLRGALGALATVAICLSAAAAQQTFQISSLTADNSSIIEHVSVTGDDRGGIALSDTNLFYTGDSATGRFDVSNLSNTGLLSPSAQYDALASNLKTRQVYSLGSLFGPIAAGGGEVSRLIALDPDTGAPTGAEILLSMPININSGITSAGIYSGWDRIVLTDGNTMQGYNIDLPSGTVTSLGFINLYADSGLDTDRCGCENWATWGVAEYANGTIRLAYAASPNFFGLNGFGQGSIKRYDVGNGTITTLADFPTGISDMCSFTVDPATSRWYFHYEGYSGAFNFGNDENIGFATASFASPSNSTASISGRVLKQKGVGLPGVVVRLTYPDGRMATTLTNSFGRFAFTKLPVGGSYAVSVSAKRYTFTPDSELVVVNEDVSDLEFQAD
ncbi:MAG: carboxypeptidase-like regulatory domain-containing protein [Pyrinomonadaceae bacterium]